MRKDVKKGLRERERERERERGENITTNSTITLDKSQSH